MTKTTLAISGILFVLILLACTMTLFWSPFGYSHVYPAVVSIGFLTLGFYYLKTWIIPNHFLFGIILIVLVPVVFLTSQILFSQDNFLKTLISEGQNLILTGIALLKNGINHQSFSEPDPGKILRPGNQIMELSHWWVLLFLFGNWLTFNRRFSFQRFISVNFSILMFVLFFKQFLQTFGN